MVVLFSKEPFAVAFGKNEVAKQQEYTREQVEREGGHGERKREGTRKQRLRKKFRVGCLRLFGAGRGGASAGAGSELLACPLGEPFH